MPPRRQAFGRVTYEQAKDGKPAFLGQSGKRGDCTDSFHDSNNMETL